jgi:hypothetical protein
MLKIGSTLLFSALVAVLLPGLACADVVEFTTGQRVEGQLKQVTAASVIIAVGGQTITFERAKVRAIYFGAAPPAAGAQPTLLKEALRALKSLQSVSRAGVIYRDYTPRVSDTKIHVDGYLESRAADQRIKKLMAEAMELYIFAGQAWNSRIRNAMGDQIYNHGTIALCPALREHLDTRQPEPPLSVEEVREIAVWNSMAYLWNCASDRITEIEKMSGVE